ncbi:MAG TPA: hypothetical protein VH877_09690, partial [Polyangia bacterium]|nr:hypothetical protein [Polyangia bacterium]
EQVKDAFPRLQLLWADGAYAGALLDWVAQLRKHNPLRLEIIKRKKNIKDSSCCLTAGRSNARLHGWGGIAE